MNCRRCGREIPAARRLRRAVFCSNTCRHAFGAEETKKLNPHRQGLSTGAVGAISELIATIDLMQRGYEVFRAVSPACSCDLAALRDGKLTRVEVRTGTRYMTGSVSYSLAESEKHRHDVLAVVVDGEVTYTPDLVGNGLPGCLQNDDRLSDRPVAPPENDRDHDLHRMADDGGPCYEADL